MNTHQIVEAVLFASDAPLKADEIARADEMLDEDQVEDALQFLRAEYDDAGRAFQLVEVAEGHQVLTRPEYAPYLERFDTVPRPSRLSGPALETLAIIAYRQPIGRIEVEYIRGVGSSGVIRTLQDRALVEVVGRAEGLGRPLLYGTTTHFLEHFGFKSMEDLPRPEELPVVLRDRISLEPESDDEGEESAEEAAAGEEHDTGSEEDRIREGTVDDAVAEAVAGLEEVDAPEAPSAEGEEAVAEAVAEPEEADASESPTAGHDDGAVDARGGTTRPSTGRTADD